MRLPVISTQASSTRARYWSGLCTRRSPKQTPSTLPVPPALAPPAPAAWASSPPAPPTPPVEAPAVVLPATPPPLTPALPDEAVPPPTPALPDEAVPPPTPALPAPDHATQPLSLCVSPQARNSVPAAARSALSTVRFASTAQPSQLQ